MLLRSVLLLLATVVLLADAQSRKIDGILKNVGKRFSSGRNIKIQMDKIHNRQWKLKKDEFDAMTDEEVSKDKWENAKRIGERFVFQQSSQNEDAQGYADLLMGMSNTTMTATICGGAPLGYYKFHHHLHNQRKTWLPTLKRNVAYTMMESNRETLQFLVSFEQLSTWGYTSTIIYRIQGTVDLFNRNTHYLMTHVDVLGGCSESGTVDLSRLGVSMTEQEIWKKDTDVQQLFKLFTPGSLEYAHQPEDSIPSIWLLGLETGDRFSGATCQRPEENVVYTNEQFTSWWKRFGMMWHPKPGEKNFIKTQILKSVPNEELMARITMSLQHGDASDSPIVDWDMKIRAEFNKRGDNRWYITRAEVGCPVTENVFQMMYNINYDAIVDGIKRKFVRMIADSTQWFSSIEVLREYQKPGGMIITACKRSVRSIADLEKKFWGNVDDATGKIFKYTMHPTTDAIGESVQLSQEIELHTKPGIDHSYITYWTFDLKWDKMDQFYYIHTADFGCLHLYDRSTICIHKICTFTDFEYRRKLKEKDEY